MLLLWTGALVCVTSLKMINIYIYIYIYIYTYIYSKNRASNFKVYAMAMDRSLGTGHARGYVS